MNRWLFPILFLGLNLGYAQAQCRNPVQQARPGAHRISRTAAGVPVRWVQVDVPAYARQGCRGNGFYNPYGFGFNGFGYGYGYGFNGYGRSAGVVNTGISYNRRRQPRKAARKADPLPIDTSVAHNYRFHKALETFVRENSLAGKIYLKQDGQSWLLQPRSQAKLQNGQVRLLCWGKAKSGHDQELLLEARFDGKRILQPVIRPQ